MANTVYNATTKFKALFPRYGIINEQRVIL